MMTVQRPKFALVLNLLVAGSRAIAAISIMLLASCSSSHDEKIAATVIKPAVTCSSLVSQLSLPNTIIESVELDAGGGIDSGFPNAGPKPENCVVTGKIDAYTSAYTNPDTGSNAYGTRFELRLPTQWNGRFFYQGGGGDDGYLVPATGVITGQPALSLTQTQTPALWRGFAVVSSDGGHRSGDTQAAYFLGGFGVDPKARVNYGYASIGQVTPVAKQIIAQYYATKPAHSYFLGCSKGGQEAMVVTQKYGDQFDGVVAGELGFHIPHATLAMAKTTQVLADVVRTSDPSAVDSNGNLLISNAFSSVDLVLLRQGVLQACDALDGLTDGMIFNTAACAGKFDPATLQCSGAKTDTCLSAEQVTAVRKIFDGAKFSDGSAAYAAFPYDTDMDGFMGWTAWNLGFPGAENSAYNVSYGQSAAYVLSTPPNPSLDMFTLNIDQFAQTIKATSGDYNVSAVDFMDADSTNLDTFKKNGGKIIYYHGGSDPVFSMNDTIDYYNQLSSAYGSDTSNFARLFLVPGQNHCVGGAYTTDYFDALDAIVNWVEKDQAPDAMIARPEAQPSESKLLANMTRPLCAYPKYAQYKGSGDVNDAANFSCK